MIFFLIVCFGNVFNGKMSIFNPVTSKNNIYCIEFMIKLDIYVLTFKISMRKLNYCSLILSNYYQLYKYIHYTPLFYKLIVSSFF